MAAAHAAQLSPGLAPSPRRLHPIANLVTAGLVVFLVLFPKGGFKIGNIPITWGYLFFGLTCVPLALIRIAGFPLRARRFTLLAAATLLPLYLVFFYSWKVYGTISDAGTLSSMFLGFFLFPFIFLFVYPVFYDRIDGARLAALLRFCILAAALFGIFCFFCYPLTGTLPQIPFLTVNAADYDRIIQTKHIARGAFIKLISTYNNGNLYGVCTLMLLPLYEQLEPRAWKRIVLKVALVFTLSRTVWAGLIVEQALSLLRVGFNAALTFPRFYPAGLRKHTLVLVFTAAAILGALLFNSSNLQFLFDAQLGGRAEYVTSATEHITLLPSGPFFGFLEVIYATALQSFGVVGLLAFLLVFGGPILLLLLNHRAILRSPLRTAAFKGLLIYMILAASDGGLTLIPVLAFYWFVYMIFLENWPGGDEFALVRKAHATTRTPPQPRRAPTASMPDGIAVSPIGESHGAHV